MSFTPTPINPSTDPVKPSPFIAFTQRVIPATFDESLSYQEALYALLNYINKLSETVNENAVIADQQTAVITQLTDYVNHYFDNLDVQEEINNKLDQMAESGELSDIIAQYLQLAGVLAYNTIADLSAAENLANGSTARVLGNTSYKDGNGAYYKIRPITSADVVDGLNIVAITAQPTLIAERVPIETNPKITFVSSTTEHGDMSDCTVINSNKNVIIDLGYETTAASLLNFLHSNNINKIDYIIISHFHDDHVGGTNAAGLSALLSDNSIDFSSCQAILPHKDIDYTEFLPSANTVIPALENQIISILTSHGISYSYPENEDSITLDTNENLTFYNIGSDFYNDYYTNTTDAYGVIQDYTNYNNFSMVVKYSFWNTTSWFTADIEKPAQNNISDYIDSCDLLKIEHHALNLSSDQKYLNQLQPKYGVVCNREYIENDQDIENSPTIYAILSKKAKLYSTRNNINPTFHLTHDDILNPQATNDTLGVVGTSTTGGQQIPMNADLDDYIISGTYFSQSSGFSASFSNCPINYAGFRLDVNTTAFGKITQKITLSNSSQPRIFYRSTNNGVFGDWKALIPSLYSNTDTQIKNSCTHHESVSLSSVSIGARMNGVTRINFEFTTTASIGAYNNLITIPKAVAKCTGRNNLFFIFDTAGSSKAMYTRTESNGDIVIRSRQALDNGHTFIGSTLEIESQELDV